MFVFPEFIDLPLIWSILLAVAVLMYVLLDGFDLGIGILFPFAPTDKCRDTMMNSIAPFWDGNETWLILGGGGLMVTMPHAFAVLMPAFYVPVILMLCGLIFRGVAFEFRFKANTSRYVWDIAFHAGSLLAAFSQGLILGGFVQGVEVTNKIFSGGPFDWLTGFSMFCGLGVIAGYALLGATWLVMKAEGQTHDWAARAGKYTLGLVLVCMAIISLWVPFLSADIAARWFGGNHTLLFLPIPLLTLYAARQCWVSLSAQREYACFLWALAIFLGGYVGLGASVWPNIVPQALTIWEAAASPESMSLVLIGALVFLPVILFYTGYCYWVFRGKAKVGEGYGH